MLSHLRLLLPFCDLVLSMSSPFRGSLLGKILVSLLASRWYKMDNNGNVIAAAAVVIIIVVMAVITGFYILDIH